MVPIANDGLRFQRQSVVRPSVVNLPSGETADFEFVPDRPGDVVLAFGAEGQQLQARVRFVASSESR